MKNTMTINVFRINDETGEKELKRVYPCSMIFNSKDDSTMKVIYNSGNEKKYFMDVEVNAWYNEFYEIEAN